MVARRSVARHDDAWLPLGEASRLLGVNADSLRRWADEGLVEIFTTPGGHRRFARRSLERLVAAGRSTRRRALSRLGATPDRVSAAYRRSHLFDGSVGLGAASEVSDPDRAAFRQDGRRLVETLLSYLDTAEPAERASAEAAATAIASSHARRRAAGGASLHDSIALFVAARRPFLAELGAVGRHRRLDPDRLTALFEDASGLFDRLLLEFIAAHRAPSTRRSAPR